MEKIDNPYVLRLVNISKGFTPFAKRLFFIKKRGERLQVLKEINLQIRKNEIVSLVGKNASGKTTLLKICCGLLLPDSGQIIKEDQKIKTAFVDGEAKGFYPRLSGTQNLDFFLNLNGIPFSSIKSKFNEIAKKFAQLDFLEKPFQLMSTGEKQKLQIILPLLLHNNLFLFDELTKSLDPHTAYNIKKFIREKLLLEFECSIVWVTHNVNEAIEMGKRILVLKQGVLTILENPANAQEIIMEM